MIVVAIKNKIDEMNFNMSIHGAKKEQQIKASELSDIFKTDATEFKSDPKLDSIAEQIEKDLKQKWLKRQQL